VLLDLRRGTNKLYNQRVLSLNHQNTLNARLDVYVRGPLAANDGHHCEFRWTHSTHPHTHHRTHTRARTHTHTQVTKQTLWDRMGTEQHEKLKYIQQLVEVLSLPLSAQF
jgi:hypothetical protein